MNSTILLGTAFELEEYNEVTSQLLIKVYHYENGERKMIPFVYFISDFAKLFSEKIGYSVGSSKMYEILKMYISSKFDYVKFEPYIEVLQPLVYDLSVKDGSKGIVVFNKVIRQPP